MAHERATVPLWIAVLLVLSGARDANAQAEKLDLGFRWQLVQPGRGSTLFVTAPPELCVDGSRELQVTWFATEGRVAPIVRILAGPSRCAWQIQDVPREGSYRAVIRVGRTGDIVADGQAEVGSDGIARLDLAALQVDVTGRVTLDGAAFATVPMVADLRIRFQRQNQHWPYWEGPIAPDGLYGVKLGNLTPDESVCALIRTAQSMNNIHSGRCELLQSGHRAMDVDFYLPQPGLIRIEIPPDRMAPLTRVIELAIDPVAPEGPDRRRPLRRVSGSVQGFRALDGLTTEFLAQRTGEYDVHLIEPDFTTVSPVTGAARKILTRRRVTLSAEQPVVSLTLRTP
jgi:hypothetical protein